MKLNLPQQVVLNDEAKLETLEALFGLNPLVLDSQLNIAHISNELSTLLAGAKQATLTADLNDILLSTSVEDFKRFQEESLTTKQLSVESVLGQEVQLQCCKISLANLTWLVVTQYHLAVVEDVIPSDCFCDQAVFAQLLVSPESFSIFSANDLATKITGYSKASLTNMSLADLTDTSLAEFREVLRQSSPIGDEAIDIHVVILGDAITLKVSKISNHGQEALLVYLLDSGDSGEQSERLAYIEDVSTSIFESRNHPILLMDSLGNIAKANAPMMAFLDLDNIEGQRASNVLPEQLNQLISTFSSSSHEVTINNQGQLQEMVFIQTPLRDERERALGLLIEIKEPENKTKDMRYRALFSASIAAGHAIFITDSQGIIQFVNEVFERQTGYSSADILNKHVSVLISDVHNKEYQQYLWDSVQQKEPWRGVIKTKKQSGVNFWSELVVNPLLDSHGEIECVAWLSQDVTLDKEQQKSGTYTANYDVATGLANAVLGRDRLEGMLGRARRRKLIVAVLCIDVSFVEQLTMSHDENIANSILTQYCERLKSTLRAEDSLARISKYRVIIMLPDLPDLNAIEVVTAKIAKVNAQEILLEDKPVEMNLQTGLAYFPQKGQTADALLKNAETALLKAWNNRCDFGFFGQENSKKSLMHFQLRRELPKVIESKVIDVVYQPICEVKGDGINSIEASLRWNHSTFGLIENDEIYTLAEASGCVQELGFMLLRQVCQDTANWCADGYDQFKVALKISHGQLRDRQVAKRIQSIVAEFGLPIERLSLEIPLSFIATQWLDLEGILEELSLMGVSLYYDKFGERGAYISDLRNFPFNGIKLSQQYVDLIDDDPSAANLVKGMIAMANSLNLDVTAVGVRELSQLLQLQEMNCDFAQGDFFSSFISSDDLSQFFVRSLTRPAED